MKKSDLPFPDFKNDELIEDQKLTEKSIDSFWESVMRVSLASFGGALVGLSRSRRSHMGRNLSRPLVQHRVSPYESSNLVFQWSVVCAVFSSLLEISRTMSPISYWTDHPHVQTIGNFSLGGLVAGSVLRGLPVRGGRSGDIIVTPRVGSGIIPGLLLGIAAGTAQIGTQLLEDYLHELENAHNAKRSEEQNTTSSNDVK
jgi:hypothetical protein